MTIIKTEEDKKEFIELISDAFQQVMISALDNMEYRIKTELGETIKSLSIQVDSLNRKFDAMQSRFDKHNERIKVLEKIHSNGAHAISTV